MKGKSGMLFKKPGGVNWLIVFLGNQGVKYEGTRHNAGFMTADVMAKNKGVAINRLRFKALTAQLREDAKKEIQTIA